MNERTVTCGHGCGRERIVRCANGIRVTCPGCGRLFKVSPELVATVPSPNAASTGTDAHAPAPATTTPESAPDGPKKLAATGTVAGEGQAPARVSIDVAPEEPVVPPAPEPIPRAPLDPVPTHPQTETGKVHGAKGGRSRRATGAGRFAERFR